MVQDDPAVSDFALDGLKQMMAVKSRVVLPFLVPQVRQTVIFSCAEACSQHSL